MHSFGLLVGHMVGDYLLQNDWMAKYKATPFHGKDPWKKAAMDPYRFDADPEVEEYRQAIAAEYRQWLVARGTWWLGHLACTVHCLLYTLAVWLFSYEWMPWWGLAVCFAAHWPVDRFGLAAGWMRTCSGQKFFASKDHPMWPNGVVLVDNTFHLVVLCVIGKLAGA